MKQEQQTQAPEAVFSEAELQLWQPPEKISFWDWLPLNFVLTNEYSEVVGPFPRDLVPAFKIIADWLNDDRVREVVIRKPTQIGMTTFIIAWFIYRQYCQPGPAIFTLADQDTAEEMSLERFSPAFENAKCFEGVEITATKKGIDLSTGGKIKMAWASSIAKLASFSAATYSGDELTKPGFSLKTKEGDTPGRLRQRAKSFEHTGKGILTSTVTEAGDVMNDLEDAADCVYTPYLPCPVCGCFQPLFFFPDNKYRGIDGAEHIGGHVTWDKAEGLTKYQRAKTARYKCGECDALWTNEQKNASMRLHTVEPDREVTEEGSTRFYMIWRIHEVRTAGSLRQITLDFFDAKESGKPDKLQTYFNNVLSLYWKEVVQEQTDATVRESVIEYDRDKVPDQALALIATVDVQKYGYWYLIRAWASNETSWKMEHGFVSTEEELDHILFEKTWPSCHGAMKIWRAAIDVGGGEHAESGETSSEWVYMWYLRNLRRGCQLVLTKGASNRLREEIKIGDPIFTLPSGKKLPQALRIVLIDTTKTKDLLFYRIGQAKEETPICPAYVSHQEKPEYFKQLQSEHKVKEKGRSVYKQQGSQANHLLDCEQMQMAVSSRLLRGGVFLLREPVGVVQVHQAQPDDAEPEEYQLRSRFRGRR